VEPVLGGKKRSTGKPRPRKNLGERKMARRGDPAAYRERRASYQRGNGGSWGKKEESDYRRPSRGGATDYGEFPKDTKSDRRATMGEGKG